MSRSKCPKCGAGRGLATYDNGDYCHACSYKEHTRHLIDYEKNSEVVRNMELPTRDLTIEMPKEKEIWLQKSYITKQQIEDNNIFYSIEYNRICFPRYVDDIMVSAWLRSTEQVKDKWM